METFVVVVFYCEWGVAILAGAYVCEDYQCSFDGSCYHGYKHCNNGENCFAAYNVDDDGRLTLSAKNCLGLPTLFGSNCR